MLTTGDPIALAREISDGVLFPGALEADASEVVPIDRLDRLADAGFYGLAGPRDAGGMGLSDFGDRARDHRDPCLRVPDDGVRVGSAPRSRPSSG